MQLIDSHCHLDATEFDVDRAEVVARAAAAGVSRILVPAVTAAAFAKTLATGHQFPAVRVALGLHPIYMSVFADEHLEQLDAVLSAQSVVAVGEIGLDHSEQFAAGDLTQTQWRVFIAQLKLAKKHNLPVILHARKSIDLILKGLRQVSVPGGIVHAFNGSAQQADEFIKLGFKIGYGGNITYDSARRIRALAAELPIEAIVLETDAPDMPPSFARHVRNEPANLAHYLQSLSFFRNIPAADLAQQIWHNAMVAVPGLE